MMRALRLRITLWLALRRRRKDRAIYSAASRKGVSTYWSEAIKRDRLFNQGKPNV